MEGEVNRRAARCLGNVIIKRYIAREVFTLIKSRRREINQARAAA